MNMCRVNKNGLIQNMHAHFINITIKGNNVQKHITLRKQEEITNANGKVA